MTSLWAKITAEGSQDDGSFIKLRDPKSQIIKIDVKSVNVMSCNQVAIIKLSLARTSVPRAHLRARELAEKTLETK